MALRDALKMAANGWHSNPLKSRRSQFGRPSGPGALCNFMLARRRSTSEGSITKSNMWGFSSSDVSLGSKEGRQPEILTKKSLISSAIGTSDWYSCSVNPLMGLEW